MNTIQSQFSPIGVNPNAKDSSGAKHIRAISVQGMCTSASRYRGSAFSEKFKTMRTKPCAVSVSQDLQGKTGLSSTDLLGKHRLFRNFADSESLRNTTFQPSNLISNSISLGFRLRNLNSNVGSCLTSKIRYTPSKCLITRGFSGRSPRQSVAFFASIASMDVGGESGNTSRLAESRLLTPTSTSSLNNGVVGLKDSFRSNTMARAKSSSTATPTHFFYPKFKKGDICRLKRCTGYPEINGLTVTLQSDLIATKNSDNLSQAYLGYRVDLVYKGKNFCIQEDQLIKIGEVEL